MGYNGWKELITMRKVLYFLPSILWVVLLFTLSSQSFSQQSITPALQQHVSIDTMRSILPDMTILGVNSQQRPYHFVEVLFRKNAHLFVYFCMAIFLYITLTALKLKKSLLPSVIVLLLIPLLAAADEWNQSFNPGRTSSVRDLWIDTFGGYSGLLLSAVIHMIVRRLRNMKPGLRKIPAYHSKPRPKL
jgi:VanZ family protein